jgi:TetR/AcrR family tetracycline transcriptional repressor
MATQPLTPDRIISEAIALMQEQGLDAVSLRRLAARLGVQAMSIYWHIRNKDELLGLMSQKIFADAMTSLPDCRTWQEWGRGYGLGLWAMYRDVRDAARLTFSLNHSEEDFRRFAQGIADHLARLGLDANQSILLHSSIQSLVIGWAGFDRSYGETMGKLFAIAPAMAQSLDALIAGLESTMAVARG